MKSICGIANGDMNIQALKAIEPYYCIPKEK